MIERDTVSPLADSVILNADTTAYLNPIQYMAGFEFEMIDFQHIKKGEPVYGRFAFSVAGTEPLEIELVSTCECIESDWSRGPVNPGENGEIIFKFDSTDEGPEVFKTFDVIFKNTDDKGYPLVKQLYLKGFVER